MKKVLLFALLWAIAVLLLSPSQAQSEVPQTATSTPTQERTIRYYADLYDVDYGLARAIATCESKLDPSAKNPYSTAKGLFQFLNGTWKYYGLKKWGSLEGRDVLDYGDNAELAVWVIAKYGTTDWNASKHCWA